MLPNIRVLVGEVYLSVSDHPTSYICRCKCNAHEDTKNDNIHCYRWHDAGFPARAEFRACSYYCWKRRNLRAICAKCVCVCVCGKHRTHHDLRHLIKLTLLFACAVHKASPEKWKRKKYNNAVKHVAGEWESCFLFFFPTRTSFTKLRLVSIFFSSFWRLVEF